MTKVKLESKGLTPLRVLHAWADQGWLRRLDSAMAAFIRELDPNSTTTLLVSTAVLAQMEGRGHTCLPLKLLINKPNHLLSLPDEAQEELESLWSTLPDNLPDWLSELRACPLVRHISPLTECTQDDTGQPLVLSGSEDEPLLYLRRYYLHEEQVANDILQRTTAAHPVDETQARHWLDRLFGSDTAGEVDWQKLACAVALRASLTVITGGPGTGKTYTAARLLALLFAIDKNPERLRVALAAPTGKAAARLRRSIDSSLQELDLRLGDALNLDTFTRRMGAARTLHSLLGARPDTRLMHFNASHPLDIDILIVDEASMIHLEMMSALLQAMPAGAKVILLGDKDQLASVEAGAVLGDLCRGASYGNYNLESMRYIKSVTDITLPAEFLADDLSSMPLAQQTVMLRRSRRFGGLIGQLALAVNDGNGIEAQRLISSDTTGILQTTHHPTVATVLNLAVHGRSGATACYADYLQLMNPAKPEDHDAWVKSVLTAFDRFRILCAVHDGDWGTNNLNTSVQQALTAAGLLKPKGEWFSGRPVMVTRNDVELGVFNGDIGVIREIDNEELTLAVSFFPTRSEGASWDCKGEST